MRPATKGEFVGRDALAGVDDSTVTRRLTCLTVDDPAQVVLGHEPVLVDGVPSGHVTSAAFGYTSAARSPTRGCRRGSRSARAVDIRYFGRDCPARRWPPSRWSTRR